MTMNQSESIGNLATALATAQAEMDFAKKDSSNPFFKSSYADLASVWEVCRTVLPKNGLAIIQTAEPAEAGRLRVRTTLAHKSGEWIAGVLDIPAVKNDPQAYGSAITYARRYSLAAIVGVIADDDDGEAAMGRGESKVTPKPARAAPLSPPRAAPQADMITSDQRKHIMAMIGNEPRQKRLDDINNWLAARKEPPVSSTNELTKSQASSLIDAIQRSMEAA